jgi:F0F1-type ATP synthase delta subunit
MMHHADRWAAAFLGTLGEKSEAALVCLKNLSTLLKPIGAVLFGRSAAASIEEMLTKEFTIQKDHSNGTIIEHEYAIRFICLLIEKNLFRNVDVIIKRIESMLDEKNGVLNVTLETASAEDESFKHELSKMIQEYSRAAHVKIKMHVVPELLAGCRLEMGGAYIDASLKGQLEQMRADLIRA